MSSRDRKRGLREDERELWSHIIKKIEPLRARPLPSGEEAAEDAPPPRRGKTSTIVPVREPKPARQEPALTPLNRREKQRVSRGKADIDARLDLHGYTQAEAHAALLRFLRRASDDGAKLVLVITGKSGVLRQQVPHWLGLPEFRVLVIGFDAAGVRHGGEGALYVRVRRARG
ncbi:MAG: Smr/MutS family protein [Pseudolabrys sp.]|nr:Smr/MutS family protein [Pseudolabrys sp.]MBV9260156.1 Smr/MutS family protein [Pseudolabrys sp.]